MDIKIRNKINNFSRWNKIHQNEIKNINHNSLHKSRICGFLAGDGNLVDKRYYIRFYPDHKSLIKPYLNSIEIVYNKKPKIIPKKNHYEIILSSKVIYQDLQKQCDFGIKNWNIPKKLLKFKENRIEWLKAFFDAEGHVHQKHLKLSSINEEGLQQVKNLLKTLGVNSRIYSYQPKNNNHSKTHQLLIYRKKDIQKYKELIGFNHSKKMGKLYKQF